MSLRMNQVDVPSRQLTTGKVTCTIHYQCLGSHLISSRLSQKNPVDFGFMNCLQAENIRRTESF